MSRWHQSTVKICLQICITQAISGTLHAAINLKRCGYNFFLNVSWEMFCSTLWRMKARFHCFMGKHNKIWNPTPLLSLRLILYNYLMCWSEPLYGSMWCLMEGVSYQPWMSTGLMCIWSCDTSIINPSGGEKGWSPQLSLASQGQHLAAASSGWKHFPSRWYSLMHTVQILIKPEL